MKNKIIDVLVVLILLIATVYISCLTIENPLYLIALAAIIIVTAIGKKYLRQKY